MITMMMRSQHRHAVYAYYTYLLPYSTVQSPFWEANWFEASQEIRAFHGTRMFINALTSVRQLCLSWASPIQSTYPHPTSWRSVLILSTHLHLGLPSGLFPSGFPSKNLYTPLSSPIRATWPVNIICAIILFLAIRVMYVIMHIIHNSFSKKVVKTWCWTL